MLIGNACGSISGAKRQSNLKKHGFDFVYGEQRMIGIGLLDCLIVHVELDESIRIISMRKADSAETDLYYKNAAYF